MGPSLNGVLACLLVCKEFSWELALEKGEKKLKDAMKASAVPFLIIAFECKPSGVRASAEGLYSSREFVQLP